MYVYMYVCMYVCMYVRMYVHVCVKELEINTSNTASLAYENTLYLGVR